MEKNKKEFLASIDDYEDIKQQKLSMQERLEKIPLELEQAGETIRDKGLQYYNQSKREQLLSNGKEEGYSCNKINMLLEFVDDSVWNQDEVSLDIINEFRHLESFVDDNYPKYKQNILYKFGSFFSSKKE